MKKYYCSQKKIVLTPRWLLHSHHIYVEHQYLLWSAGAVSQVCRFHSSVILNYSSGNHEHESSESTETAEPQSSQEMDAPHVIWCQYSWPAADLSLTDHSSDSTTWSLAKSLILGDWWAPHLAAGVVQFSEASDLGRHAYMWSELWTEVWISFWVSKENKSEYLSEFWPLVSPTWKEEKNGLSDYAWVVVTGEVWARSHYTKSSPSYLTNINKQPSFQKIEHCFFVKVQHFTIFFLGIIIVSIVTKITTTRTCFWVLNTSR